MEEIKFNKNNTILVVWDVQKMLVENIFNKEEFLNGLNKTIEFCRKNSIPILFTKITPYPKGFEPKVYTKMKWRGEFKPEMLELYIKPEENDIIINKNTWSLFVGTNVELLLRNSGRNVILFTGIATEIGVETSARHAYALGFTPIIIEDAVSSSDKEGHLRSLENMKKFFLVIKSDELEKYII